MFNLELYFAQIVDAICIADATLERSCFRALKPYWSPELTFLKRQSFMHHKAWLENGKPSFGEIHDRYFDSRAIYRHKLRQ